MNKDLIFISHASSEDNYYAAWLASKLNMLGYNVWVDLDNLNTGDSFNSVIKPIIKEKAKIFIALTTLAYTNKSNDQNSGVSRELNCAATITSKDLNHNFIFPVRFDNVSYDNFPYQYIGWNTINFENNWQQGLIDLINELDKINFPKKETANPIDIWFKAIKAQNKTLKKVEKYYSNWFECKLPKKIYIHNPLNFNKQEVYTIPFPYTIEANKIITFAAKETINKFVTLKNSFEFETIQFLNIEDIIIKEENFVLKEGKKKLIRLLNIAFSNHLFRKGLINWKHAKQKKKIFYFKHSNSQKRINLKRFNKPLGRRALTGNVNENINGDKQLVNWAFSISHNASIEPIPHFNISYGLVFTDKNFIRFDKDIHHKLRRSVPSGWYNRKWLETLLSAMLSISPSLESHFIEIEIDEEKILKVNNEPLYGFSKYGYLEPHDIE